jgi:hypothetical protein
LKKSKDVKNKGPSRLKAGLKMPKLKQPRFGNLRLTSLTNASDGAIIIITPDGEKEKV